MVRGKFIEVIMYEFKLFSNDDAILGDISECVNFGIWRNTPRHKWGMEIHTIRYMSSQKNCTLSGTTILNWIRKLKKDNIISNFKLEDASSYTLPKTNIKINLSRFRKFTTGQGWYESFGFLAESSHENKMYQQEFTHFRNAPINHLCFFIWCLIKPFMRYDENRNHHYYLTTLDSKVIEHTNNEGLYNAISLLNPTNKPNFRLIRNLLLTLERNSEIKDTLVNILIFYGVNITDLDVSTLNAHQYMWYNELLPQNKSPCTCILKCFTPGNIRKLIDKTLESGDSKDMNKHIQKIEHLLHVMEEASILSTPMFLNYPTKHKTHKVSSRRCTVSNKKKCIKIYE
jgi:hypothetical protein